MNKLPGVPKEYYDYVYTPKNESVEALADCIKQVLHLTGKERNTRANAGRQFILETKNSNVQVARVLSMISTY